MSHLFGLLLCLLLSGTSWADDWRLPGDLEAASVSLSVEADLVAFQFDGVLEMSLHVKRPTTRLVFNAKDLTVAPGSAVLTSPGGSPVRLTGLEVNPDLERITLVSSEVLRPDDGLYKLNMVFRGKINDDGVGFYRASYTSPTTGQTRWMGATQLRPVHARRVFPCLDEPVYRSTFTISITHDQQNNAISNMPKASTVKTGSNKVVTTFRTTPRIPAFLVGFVVSDLGSVSGGRDLAFKGWAVPHRVDEARYAAVLGPRLARAMEAHLGLTYPHHKTDLVALPRLIPVAMENWGLFTFREGNMLYKAGVSRTIQAQNAARFVAHEIMHAWMGNTVTIAWWDFLWLSEVFAMYYEYYMPSLVEPSWRMVDQMVLDLHQSGLLADSLPVDPLTTTIATPQQISAKFSGITYSKGPALLRMVIHAVTEAEFLKGFRRFLISNAYSDVEPDDLWNCVDRPDRLPANLSTIMDNWTRLSGYPVVTVTRNYTTGRVQLKQATFSLEGGMREDERMWWIPLTFTSRAHCDFTNTLPKMWFPPQRNQHFRLAADNNDWVIFNIQSTGFYRVNYDARNWLLLTRQLEDDPLKMGVLSRALLLDDSLNLARGGLLNYQTPLLLADYLCKEYDFVPWQSALNAFTFLDNMLVHETVYPKFKEYMRWLLKNVYEEVRFEESPGGREPHLKKLTREIVVRWACRMGHQDCVRRSISHVESLAHGPSRISVDVKDTALCTAAAEGGEREWNTLLGLSGSTDLDAEQRNRYLNAVGCTKSPDRIAKFLIDSVNELKEAEWMGRLAALARRKENAAILLTLLVDNFAKITNRFGDGQFVSFINQISGFLTTKQQANVLRDLDKRGLQGLSGSINGISSRAAWIEARLPEISKYLDGLHFV